MVSCSNGEILVVMGEVGMVPGHLVSFSLEELVALGALRVWRDPRVNANQQ